ncbi:MAG TPA: histidine phosphatase family protein [Lysobacter sp.]|jgi:broad specificity phosphatase PhoE|nr:histidine phosphatase family protein [Lysobacter sp.]
MNRRISRRSLLVFALLAASLSSCAGTPAAFANGATFVVVRHAEKTNDGSKDPALTPAGQTRAQNLATSLHEVPLKAIYATAYQRTQMTAAPSAQAHGLPVTTYDAKQPAAELAAQLRHEYRNGTVLIVGHSNTAPEIAAALCNCTVAPMGENEYDRRLAIRIDANGDATLHEDHY